MSAAGRDLRWAGFAGGDGRPELFCQLAQTTTDLRVLFSGNEGVWEAHGGVWIAGECCRAPALSSHPFTKQRRGNT